MTWDRHFSNFWLTDYFPEILDIDRMIFPSWKQFESALGAVTISEVLIPHDCSDGFLGAYWRRPEAYLDADVRNAISTFTKITGVDAGLAKLDRDLQSGAWHDRNSGLLNQTHLDLGYRLVIAEL